MTWSSVALTLENVDAVAKASIAIANPKPEMRLFGDQRLVIIAFSSHCVIGRRQADCGSAYIRSGGQWLSTWLSRDGVVSEQVEIVK
jgi:hypothetical protein